MAKKRKKPSVCVNKNRSQCNTSQICTWRKGSTTRGKRRKGSCAKKPKKRTRRRRKSRR